MFITIYTEIDLSVTKKETLPGQHTTLKKICNNHLHALNLTFTLFIHYQYSYKTYKRRIIWNGHKRAILEILPLWQYIWVDDSRRIMLRNTEHQKLHLLINLSLFHLLAQLCHCTQIHHLLNNQIYSTSKSKIFHENVIAPA